jgi:hypothetical protein
MIDIGYFLELNTIIAELVFCNYVEDTEEMKNKIRSAEIVIREIKEMLNES